MPEVRGAVLYGAAVVRHGGAPVPHLAAAGRARAGSDGAPGARGRHGGRPRQAQTLTAAGLHTGGRICFDWQSGRSFR